MAVQLKYSDNWDELKKEFKKIGTQENRINTATISNTAPFARYLQDRAGFYVFNDEKAVSIVNRRVRRWMRGKRFTNNTELRRGIKRGIIAYVNWLRSTTGKTRPGIRKGMRPRKAHPGGWADITGFLNNSYRYRVNNEEWKREKEWVRGMAAADAKFQELYGRAPNR